ncbi:protein CONSERVED ONLY IN THE GREEN LINEAGE 160 [Citrus sinensis]|uniref:protein CONSERVED ONLY IN THE GREEN LINEAGE 160, chloroplastic n=1 Tax=Citrus sinensis TaxID=2711 RepID=UPI0021907E0F|nr:protein CONSERVED ONLY IN THE GREEN LINEAGE 160, chloroplastic [Citrus sinensis]XP_024951502.2 protein CONSERVED ONLY IN THE GREEN LINEAGE 160, chloroplastic [Citrus sinensis]KAH9742855.1 protein CONSERVED ONLY IN THE GREEN LINEAGE 160 [Citrus sinensis]
MAVLNYIPVTATSAPISQDSSSTSSSVPNTRPTKILLPKKKPMKWSTGVAPGEYGGPPTTTKLRKFWGGEKEDPLTSDEFIWNNDFMPRMKRLIEDTDESSAAEKFPVQEDPSGFLSLNRVMSLDSLEVDLSKELTAPSKTALQQPVEAAIQDNQQKSGSVPRKWRLAPTRREQDKWDKATKAATGGSDVMFRELRKPRGDPEVLAAQSKEQYFKLKSKLQFLTLGIGGVGLVSAYISYSPEIAASFAAGLLGSLVYIRMLGSTVDSMAAGAKGLMKGAVGQPRLLVPVVLVMIYNRWNEITVPEYGFLHLELIPMLVGFFTYKIATFFQAVEEAVSIVEKKDPDIV